MTKPSPTCDPVDATPPRPPRRRRRWGRWACLALCLAAAGWFGRFAYLRITLRPTPRTEYWEQQLQALDPPPPGALKTDEAFAILWSFTATARVKPGVRLHYALDGPWDDSRAEIIACDTIFTNPAFVSARKDLLRAAAAGWAEVGDLSFIGYWDRSQHQSSVALLLAHSRWVRERHDDANAAIEDWIAALQIARQARRPPRPMTYRVEWDDQEAVSREMMSASRELRRPTGAKALASRVDEIVGPIQSPGQLLRGEKIAYFHYLDCIYVRTGGDWLDVSEATGWRATAPSPPSRLWNLASPLFWDYDGARRFVDSQLGGLEQTVGPKGHSAEAPRDEVHSLGIWGQVISDEQNLCGGCGPSLSQTTFHNMRRYLMTRSAIDASLAMLALEEFRRRYRRYPETLGELVPEWLPRVPTDCVDGAPLRYRANGGDYVLYSIGDDGKDDGGAARGDWRWSGPDAVFSQTRRGDAP